MEVGADILLRAIAITLVTYNHAHPYSDFSMGWGGGMTFLMMLSGYNFAKYGMDGATREEGRAALTRLGLSILIPSFIAVVGFFLLLQKFNFAELLFYRNWLTAERISKFPTWYPQVMVQMFAGLALLFSIPRVGAAIFRWPLRAALVLFGLALGIRTAFPMPLLHNHLPHLFLWNFVLGWVVYFSVTRLPGPWGKLLACASGIAGATAIMSAEMLAFWCLSVGVVLLVLPLRIRLWTPVARFVFIVSQATFAIFLLHRFVYEVYEHMPVPQNDDVEWIVGFFGSIALWIAGVVPVRAYRALRRRFQTPASSANLVRALRPSSA
ncbi:MAG: acyltransferase family protein [Steroidobacteraceae bacterium]